MKILLLVLLLAISRCSFPENILDIANCLLKSKKIKENIPKILEVIKSGDISQILFNGLSIFSEVKSEVTSCLSEPTLTGLYDPTCYPKCLNECKAKYFCGLECRLRCNFKK